MNIVPTEKLFYKKYTCCVKFKIIDPSKTGVRNNSIVRTIKAVLKANRIDSRTRIDWHFSRANGYSINFSVYLNSDAMYQKLIDTYGSYCYLVSKPVNEEHRDRLLNKVHTVFRDRLLFNRFRYKVYLYTGWRRENIQEITEWITSQFQGRHNGRTGDYFCTGNWMLTLYLQDDSDLTMVRLCLSDHIKTVMRVELNTDITQSPH